MKNMLEEGLPSHPKVKKWTAEFKQGRTSCDDNLRSGYPKVVTTEEIARYRFAGWSIEDVENCRACGYLR